MQQAREQHLPICDWATCVFFRSHSGDIGSPSACSRSPCTQQAHRAQTDGHTRLDSRSYAAAETALQTGDEIAVRHHSLNKFRNKCCVLYRSNHNSLSVMQQQQQQQGRRWVALHTHLRLLYLRRVDNAEFSSVHFSSATVNLPALYDQQVNAQSTVIALTLTAR